MLSNKDGVIKVMTDNGHTSHVMQVPCASRTRRVYRIIDIQSRANEGLKKNTQHVPLRLIVEEKVRENGLEEVWSDEND